MLLQNYQEAKEQFEDADTAPVLTLAVFERKLFNSNAYHSELHSSDYNNTIMHEISLLLLFAYSIDSENTLANTKLIAQMPSGIIQIMKPSKDCSFTMQHCKAEREITKKDTELLMSLWETEEKSVFSKLENLLETIKKIK